MKWFVLATIVVLVVAGCVPLLEERQEFVVEIVGDKYFNEVMTWYQPSFSDPLLQKRPVIVLYYPDETSSYNVRKNYYRQSSDFVAAGGDIVDTSNISGDLNSIWSSYVPQYDIDVWWQYDAGEWQAKVKDLQKVSLEGYEFFLIEFTKKNYSNKAYYEVTRLMSGLKPDSNGIFHLGDIPAGFVVILQKEPSKIGFQSETAIVGAEVVLP